jgi:nitrogen fixation NifU-like protein
MRYSSKTLHYFESLSQSGEFDAKLEGVVTAKVGHQECIQLQLQIDKTHRILQTRFKVYGSVATMASIAYLAEELINKTVSQAQEISPDSLLKALELPALKLPSTVLAHNALIAALKEHSSI